MNLVHDAPLQAWIDGIGLVGPGLTDWKRGTSILRAEMDYVPQPTVLPIAELLPPAERRRATAVIKLTLAIGLEAVSAAGLNASDLATVFTSSGGDGRNCHEICSALASSDRLISPTRFHNSVHNAASGYWGIATGAMAPSAVLCAHDASFSAGLMETLVQVHTSRQPVLLLAYDTVFPEPLHSVRPITDNFGVALALSPAFSAISLMRIVLDPSAPCTDTTATRMEEAALEGLRMGIPAARALPLLHRLARRNPGPLVLDYLPGQQLAVTLESC